MTTYLVTTKIRITATFRDLAGTLTNPTTVVCTVKNPAGVLATPIPTNSGTGIYYADVTLDADGTWTIEWQATGNLIVAGDDWFLVRLSYVDQT